MQRHAIALALLWVLGAGAPATAASLPAATSAQIARGLAAVGSRSSDEPALRFEARAQALSDGFVLGAALGAWRNAGAGLDHDVAHPLGDGGEAAAVRSDCFDEKMAFVALEAASAKLSASPADVVSAAGLSSATASAWTARRLGVPAPCR